MAVDRKPNPDRIRLTFIVQFWQHQECDRFTFWRFLAFFYIYVSIRHCSLQNMSLSAFAVRARLSVAAATPGAGAVLSAGSAVASASASSAASSTTIESRRILNARTVSTAAVPECASPIASRLGASRASSASGSSGAPSSAVSSLISEIPVLYSTAPTVCRVAGLRLAVPTEVTATGFVSATAAGAPAYAPISAAAAQAAAASPAASEASFGISPLTLPTPMLANEPAPAAAAPVASASSASSVIGSGVASAARALVAQRSAEAAARLPRRVPYHMRGGRGTIAAPKCGGRSLCPSSPSTASAAMSAAAAACAPSATLCTLTRGVPVAASVAAAAPVAAPGAASLWAPPTPAPTPAPLRPRSAAALLSATKVVASTPAPTPAPAAVWESVGRPVLDGGAAAVVPAASIPAAARAAGDDVAARAPRVPAPVHHGGLLHAAHPRLRFAPSSASSAGLTAHHLAVAAGRRGLASRARREEPNRSDSSSSASSSRGDGGIFSSYSSFKQFVTATGIPQYAPHAKSLLRWMLDAFMVAPNQTKVFMLLGVFLTYYVLSTIIHFIFMLCVLGVVLVLATRPGRNAIARVLLPFLSRHGLGWLAELLAKALGNHEATQGVRAARDLIAKNRAAQTGRASAASSASSSSSASASASASSSSAGAAESHPFPRTAAQFWTRFAPGSTFSSANSPPRDLAAMVVELVQSVAGIAAIVVKNYCIVLVERAHLRSRVANALKHSSTVKQLLGEAPLSVHIIARGEPVEVVPDYPAPDEAVHVDQFGVYTESVEASRVGEVKPAAMVLAYFGDNVPPNPEDLTEAEQRAIIESNELPKSMRPTIIELIWAQGPTRRSLGSLEELEAESGMGKPEEEDSKGPEAAEAEYVEVPPKR